VSAQFGPQEIITPQKQFLRDIQRRGGSRSARGRLVTTVALLRNRSLRPRPGFLPSVWAHRTHNGSTLHSAGRDRMQEAQQAETIFALSTPPGRGALAIIRASGPAAHAGVAALLPRGVSALPPPRVATHVRLQLGDDPLDDALLLLFAGPHSATGEDVAELHVHGSPAVVSAILDGCGRLQVGFL